MASFGLSLTEHILLLKTWVLPVMLLTARAYSATEQEERSLKVIFNTSLGFDSWGTTLAQTSLPRDEGGFSLAPPDTRLKVQNGLAFMAFANNQTVMPFFVRLRFRAWTTKFGVLWDLRSLPYLQLGPVPYSTMGFLALLPKSCSQARRYCLDGARTESNPRNLPLWHSATFKNADNLTYYCPALIRKGVVRKSDLFDEHQKPRQHLFLKVGITWQQVFVIFDPRP